MGGAGGRTRRAEAEAAAGSGRDPELRGPAGTNPTSGRPFVRPGHIQLRGTGLAEVSGEQAQAGSNYSVPRAVNKTPSHWYLSTGPQ